MAVLPCVNPYYPRVRPALAVLLTGVVAGVILAASSAKPARVANGAAPAAYASALDERP